MDRELKEYLETKEYYPYLNFTEITDEEAENIKDTMDFHLWRLRRSTKGMVHKTLNSISLKSNNGLERLQQMRDPEGFHNLWLEEVKKGKSYVQAYRDLEEEYGQLIEQAGLDDILDQRRYSSYDSFRISKNKSQQAVG